MDTPVLKLWLAKFSLAAVTMPQERTDDSFRQYEELIKRYGVRDLINGSLWSDERFTSFGVEWYPNVKALREFNSKLDALHWFQYIKSEIFLGVEIPENPIPMTPLGLDPGVDWLVHIYMSRLLPLAYDMSEAEMTEAMKVLTDARALGVRDGPMANSRPVNEEWGSWGIEFYPSLEVLVQKNAMMEKVKWYKYVQARSFLGTATGGLLVGK